MADATLPARGQKVVHRGLEEGRGGFVEGRGVRQVDDDVGPRHRLVQSLAADDVDAGGLRVRYRLVPGGVQILDDLRPDQSGTADDCELHDMPFVRRVMSAIWHMGPWVGRRRSDAGTESPQLRRIGGHLCMGECRRRTVRLSRRATRSATPAGVEPGGLARQVVALGEVGCLVGRLGVQPCRRRQVAVALVEVRRHRGVAGQ